MKILQITHLKGKSQLDFKIKKKAMIMKVFPKVLFRHLLELKID
jgi:hypothetical protein